MSTNRSGRASSRRNILVARSQWLAIRAALRKDQSQRSLASTHLRDSALVLSQLLRTISSRASARSKHYLQDKLMEALHSLSVGKDALSCAVPWPAVIGTRAPRK